MPSRNITVSGNLVEANDDIDFFGGTPGAFGPFSLVQEVDLDGPRAGEVLVEIMATGICHTDAYTLSGADPEGLFPAIRAFLKSPVFC